MTDSRLTQAAVEQWIAPLASGQVTQIAVEHWASVSNGTVTSIATQVSVEHWASVAVAGAGGGSQAIAMVLA